MIVSPVVLEGNSVRLEPMELRHVEALCEVGLDDSLWKLTTTLLRSSSDMRRYVETALDEQRAGKSLPFVTIQKSGGKVVGSTRFGNIEPNHRRVEIGWTWVAQPWQRTAINTEAKLLMLQHAFEVWDCLRVELKTDRLNEWSRRAIERIGAKEEGVLRSHMVAHDGRIRDTVYYSILSSEWPDVRRQLQSLLSAPLQ